MLVRRVSAVIDRRTPRRPLARRARASLIIDDGGGGGGGGGPIPAVITLDDQKGTTSVINTDVGSTVYPSAAECDGVHLHGLVDAPRGRHRVVPPIVVTGNATYYAQWTLNQYTVTFDATKRHRGHRPRWRATHPRFRPSRTFANGLFLRRLVHRCQWWDAGHVPVHRHRRRHLVRALDGEPLTRDVRPAERQRFTCVAGLNGIRNARGTRPSTGAHVRRLVHRPDRRHRGRVPLRRHRRRHPVRAVDP